MLGIYRQFQSMHVDAKTFYFALPLTYVVKNHTSGHKSDTCLFNQTEQDSKLKRQKTKFISLHIPAEI